MTKTTRRIGSSLLRAHWDPFLLTAIEVDAVLEGIERASPHLAGGDVVRVGWMPLRILAADDGALDLHEPDMRLPLAHVKRLHSTVLHMRRQTELAESVGLGENVLYPSIHDDVVVCRHWLGARELILDRVMPHGTDSGWYVGCGAAEHEGPSDGERITLHVVACKRPELIEFFALPVACTVAFLANGDTSIFLDGEPLGIRGGSYLHGRLSRITRAAPSL